MIFKKYFETDMLNVTSMFIGMNNYLFIVSEKGFIFVLQRCEDFTTDSKHIVL